MHDREKERLRKIAAWLAGHDTGNSSRFLAQLALGNRLPEIHYPHDPADLGRCLRFLKVLDPEQQKSVLRMAKHRSEHWEKLVERWDEAVALYEEEEQSGRAPKLYDLMKEIGL